MTSQGDDPRFLHLLQPLRDLAQNWSIDVARDLEEYLDELESISISFDGGKTNLNFAEAALLIQGSACIYSKKVEYLYSLIYKTLDMLMTKEKRRKQASSINAEGVDTDAMFAATEEFLLLDDIIEGSGNVDLEEGSDEFAAIASAAVTDPRRTPRGPGTHQNIMAKTPLSRMGTYGSLGSGGGRRSNFRLASTPLHEASGTLLLDGNAASLLDAPLDASAAGASMLLGGASPGPATGSLFGPGDWAAGLADADAPVAGGGEEVPGGDWGDDGAEGGDWAPLQPAGSGGGAPVVGSGTLRPHATRRTAPAHTDAWAALDMYDASIVHVVTEGGEEAAVPTAAVQAVRAVPAARPLRVASTRQRISNAAAVARYGGPLAAARAKALRTRPRGGAWREAVAVEVQACVPLRGPAAPTLHGGACLPTAAAPSAPDMAPHAAAYKKALGRARWAAMAAAAAATPGSMLSMEDGGGGADLDDILGGGFDDFEGGGAEDGPPPADLDFAVTGGAGSAAVAAALRFEEGLPDAGDIGYEAAVRGHIEAYLREAAGFATQTALTRRVDAWQAKLEPLLAAQEAEAPFDMAVYTAGVAQALEGAGSGAARPVPFASLVAGEGAKEVGRQFLALLQLANTGGVCLLHEGVDAAGEDVPCPTGHPRSPQVVGGAATPPSPAVDPPSGWGQPGFSVALLVHPPSPQTVQPPSQAAQLEHTLEALTPSKAGTGQGEVAATKTRGGRRGTRRALAPLPQDQAPHPSPARKVRRGGRRGRAEADAPVALRA